MRAGPPRGVVGNLLHVGLGGGLLEPTFARPLLSRPFFSTKSFHQVLDVTMNVGVEHDKIAGLRSTGISRPTGPIAADIFDDRGEVFVETQRNPLWAARGPWYTEFGIVRSSGHGFPRRRTHRSCPRSAGSPGRRDGAGSRLTVLRRPGRRADAIPKPGSRTHLLRIGKETSVAFRSAKERYFRGAKGDYATVIDSPTLRGDGNLPRVERGVWPRL